jgi:hypothetical protein
MINRITTWETKCKCGGNVYYYPAKLLLETTKPQKLDMSKRIVSLTCACKHSHDYEFPTDFKQVK